MKENLKWCAKAKKMQKITRHKIINAAREVFFTKGVSKSSLEHIAAHAGVTRGAVYWHFENKTELFHAMREQVFLPLFDRMEDILFTEKVGEAPKDPLMQLEDFFQSTILELTNNVETQQTYVIMMSKCEYVDEFASVLQQILNNCSGIVTKFEQVYAQAKNQGLLNSDLSPAQLAMDTHLFFSGLLHMWVKDSDGTLFRNQAEALISAHFRLRRK